MSFHKVKATDLSELDSERAVAGGEFLQSGFWGRFKAAFGWEAHAFRLDTVPLLVLTRRIGPFSFAYIPRGPVDPKAPQRTTSYWDELCSNLKDNLPRTTIFIRIDMPVKDIRTEGELDRPVFGPPLVKAGADIQPPDTVILDISRPEEAIRAAMKPKTRYNIRLAFKKGVEVRECQSEELSIWYELYTETAERDRIAIHGKTYYETLFSLAKNGKGVSVHLLMAYVEGKPCAGIIVLVYGKTATYLYGASSNEFRNYMPAYALQWEAIRMAKSYGCDTYDLYGIPPNEDPHHPMHGLYRFKTGFGGSILRYGGCWDFPLKPLLYRVYRFIEALRMGYFRKLKKLFKRSGDS